MIRNNINILFSTTILTQVNKNAILQVNSISSVKKIKEELRQYIEKSEQLSLKYSQFHCNYWYLIRIAANKADILGFINKLAVFIIQNQAKAKRVRNIKNK